MTGPHLTPEREAEIREYVRENDAIPDFPLVSESPTVYVADLLAALDAEREALNQARTALEASTEDLVFAALKAREDKRPKFAAALDARVQENQRVLGLAVAEADKP